MCVTFSASVGENLIMLVCLRLGQHSWPLQVQFSSCWADQAPADHSPAASTSARSDPSADDIYSSCHQAATTTSTLTEEHKIQLKPPFNVTQSHLTTSICQPVRWDFTGVTGQFWLDDMTSHWCSLVWVQPFNDWAAATPKMIQWCFNKSYYTIDYYVMLLRSPQIENSKIHFHDSAKSTNTNGRLLNWW